MSNKLAIYCTRVRKQVFSVVFFSRVLENLDRDSDRKRDSDPEIFFWHRQYLSIIKLQLRRR